MMKRYELSDDQWCRIEELLPGKAGDPGRPGADNRLFVHGVLWVLRSGAHGHDLPPRYGKWKSAHKRFTRWARAGVPQAPALLEDFRPGHAIADKAYDSNDFRTLIAETGARAVIPCNATRKHLIPYDFDIYKARNRIER